MRVLLLGVVLLLNGCLPLPQPQSDPHIRWSRELGLGGAGQHLQLQSVVEAQQLYLASHHGQVWALNRLNGKLIWQQQLAKLALAPELQRVNSGPQLLDGRLLLGSDGGLVALAAASGELLWQQALNGTVTSLPVALNRQQLLVRTANGYLYALNSDNGAIAWSYQWPLPPLTLYGEAPPVVVGELILIGTASGKLLALSHNGLPQWEFDVASSRGRNEIERLIDVDVVTAGEGVVYLSAYQYGTAAIRVDDKPGVLWSRKEFTTEPMLLYNHSLLLSGHDGQLFRLDANNGETLWRQAALAGQRLSAATLISEEELVVANSEGDLFRLSWQRGELLQRIAGGRLLERLGAVPELGHYNAPFSRKAAIFSAPVAASQGWFYTLDQRGVLLALH
ncbi:hypothetical protein D5085_02590 [Ectothiorhodospiraceae bacterium BW-2]|nr:hypothetical protein D5085_02590 [Ectothiorhodospiraceae bacterium BW-2]